MMLNSKFYTSTENSQNSFISSIGTIRNDGILIYYNKNMEYIKFENVINIRIFKEKVTLINNFFFIIIVVLFSSYFFINLNYFEIAINTFLLIMAFIFYYKFNVETTSLVVVAKNNVYIKIRLKKEQISDAEKFCKETVVILRRKNVIG